MISENKFFIYDPTFCNLSLFNPDTVFGMAVNYCEVDGYTLEDFIVKKS